MWCPASVGHRPVRPAIRPIPGIHDHDRWRRKSWRQHTIAPPNDTKGRLYWRLKRLANRRTQRKLRVTIGRRGRRWLRPHDWSQGRGNDARLGAELGREGGHWLECNKLNCHISIVAAEPISSPTWRSIQMVYETPRKLIIREKVHWPLNS